jgi:hypothetical protein
MQRLSTVSSAGQRFVVMKIMAKMQRQAAFLREQIKLS